MLIATRARVCLSPFVVGCSELVPPSLPSRCRCRLGVASWCPIQRALFTVAPAKLQWYTVEWPAAQLSWADFRGRVLGATNPAAAKAGSVRRALFDQWETLGLAKEPHTSENGVHASASPLEALFERMNW